MRTVNACLDEATLQRLACGLVPEWEAGPLERHLRECPGCAAAHDGLFTPIIEALRASGPVESLPEQEQIDELITHLEGLVKAGGIETPVTDDSGEGVWTRFTPEGHTQFDFLALAHGAFAGAEREFAAFRLDEALMQGTALAGQIAPDGDFDPGAADDTNFRVVACSCGGVLKPDVVFFGENVPKPRVDATMSALDAARSLLVVGSSLMVFSGYRFVRAAARLEKPIAVVNRGHTRADAVARVKLEGEAGVSLSEVSALL